MDIELEMTYKKTTLHTVVFEQVERQGMTVLIPTLYIRKEAYPDKTPMKIKVSVEVIE